MEEKSVKLIRKQATPFKVNFPMDGRFRSYVWNGTKGKILNSKEVPFEVYEWLAQYTTTFNEGCLIIDTEDQEANEIKESIENIDLVEKAILTQKEIEEILTTGNHLVLKGKLNELVKDLPEELARTQKRYVATVAREIGVDSSAKRKILAEWAGINVENSDLVFDKELRKIYDESEN